MTDTLLSDRSNDQPWHNGEPRSRVPDTSMLPGSEKAPTAAVGLLNNAVDGAHNAIDRLAVGAAPVVRQLGERVSAAGVTLQATSDQLLAKRDEWSEGLRTTVRSRPLTSVLVAAAVGVVIGRVMR